LGCVGGRRGGRCADWQPGVQRCDSR
jgi:hypothetical protein